MSELAIPESQQAIDAASFINEWERQPGEPKRAFTAFTYFRDDGDERSVTAVRDRSGGAYSHAKLMEWATRWRWIERADAYDRWIDRKRQKAYIEEVEAQARRQVELGQRLQGVGEEWVGEVLADEKGRRENLTATTALRFIDKGVHLERQGLGVDKPVSEQPGAAVPNILDAQTESDIFDTITRMASNVEAVEKMVNERAIGPPGPEPIDVEGEEIIDAELVEDDEGESDANDSPMIRQ